LGEPACEAARLAPWCPPFRPKDGTSVNRHANFAVKRGRTLMACGPKRRRQHGSRVRVLR
jgi:hypothetical protein